MTPLPQKLRSFAYKTALIAFFICISPIAHTQSNLEHHSIARIWNEQLLAAIRFDEARPPVHARNLLHLSIVMWDAWAAFEPDKKQVFHTESALWPDSPEARSEAISFAAYRLLQWRFKNSPNYPQTNTALTRQMMALGYDLGFDSLKGSTPAALGNRIANTVIQFGLYDGSNELNGYANQYYQPVNARLNPKLRGNPNLKFPNRWQQLDMPDFVGQSGQPAENYPPFVGPEWGNVKPFALANSDLVVKVRDGHKYNVYFDPGPPPVLGKDTLNTEAFVQTFTQVLEWSSKLDPTDGQLMDVSPASRGNNELGTNNGQGYLQNPVTGLPYHPLLVSAGDYFRTIAEYWADGPSSETPPGHWFTLLNAVSDHPALENRFAGKGEKLSDLEWDLRSYLVLGAAMHDTAVAAWSIKGWYDFVRPISAIRYLCDRGQSSLPEEPDYDPMGISLIPGLIEQITPDSSAPGQRHAHLREESGNLHGIAIRTWRGPDHIKDANTDVAGVGWIHCGDWWPYQRPNFITPPFAGYVSGHSTFSRAAAEVLTLITGSEFFPGGLAIFKVPKNEYLHFERGPSQTIQLQWATFRDAADESAQSRIYGGIHPPVDDFPGRKIGYKIGHRAFAKVQEYFGSN